MKDPSDDTLLQSLNINGFSCFLAHSRNLRPLTLQILLAKRTLFKLATFDLRDDLKLNYRGYNFASLVNHP